MEGGKRKRAGEEDSASTVSAAHTPIAHPSRVLVRLAECGSVSLDVVDAINRLPDLQTVLKYAGSVEFDCLCGKTIVRLSVAFNNATSRAELASLFASKALLGFLVSSLQTSWAFLFRDKVSAPSLPRPCALFATQPHVRLRLILSRTDSPWA